jgi:hypothetical protein
MRLTAVSVLLLLLASCSSIKRWAAEAATEIVNEKLGPIAEKQLDPVELAELRSRADAAGLTDPEGNIRWDKMIFSGNGLGVLGLFMVFLLRRRMGKKVGELWKGKADAKPPQPAVSVSPPST